MFTDIVSKGPPKGGRADWRKSPKYLAPNILKILLGIEFKL